jgi:hypothetical protein
MLYADLIRQELEAKPKTRTQLLEALMTGNNREIIRSRFYDEAVRFDLEAPRTKSKEEWVEFRWKKVSSKICICIRELQNIGYSNIRIEEKEGIYYIKGDVTVGIPPLTKVRGILPTVL